MALHISARSSVLAALLLAGGCLSGDSTGSKVDLGTGNAGDNGATTGSGTGSGTTQMASLTTLLSDQAGVGNAVSSTMINPWGIVAYQGMFWIANEGTGKVSIVDGAGKPSTGKPASDQIDLGEGITGIAVNDSMELQVTNGTTCGPANLIFASVHGKLIGVNTDINATGGSTLVDNSKTGAIYTGVATVHARACHTDDKGGAGNCQNTGPILTLATDFHNGHVDVFDESFKMLTTPVFNVPDLPADFAPFNVMVWNGIVYVTYAQQDEDKEEEVAGPGLGFVAAFDAAGTLMWTAKGNELNAPWGMSLAGDTTLFPGALLVGNFGDGHITAIDLKTGGVLGQLADARGGMLAIDGLWGIAVGTGVQNATAGALYFAAGPDDEMHGMFGLITAAPPQM